jgi:glucose-1-phosphate thymidylyltransferase
LVQIAKKVKPSHRGELEITSVIQSYLDSRTLSVTHLSRGTAWLDTGNPNSLNDAAAYVRIIEERTGLKIACLEEIAYSNNWINVEQISKSISKYRNSDYGKYLNGLIE